MKKKKTGGLACRGTEANSRRKSVEGSAHLEVSVHLIRQNIFANDHNEAVQHRDCKPQQQRASHRLRQYLYACSTSIEP